MRRLCSVEQGVCVGGLQLDERRANQDVERAGGARGECAEVAET